MKTVIGTLYKIKSESRVIDENGNTISIDYEYKFDNPNITLFCKEDKDEDEDYNNKLKSDFLRLFLHIEQKVSNALILLIGDNLKCNLKRLSENEFQVLGFLLSELDDYVNEYGDDFKIELIQF